jgi:sulfur transfer complex TusBCD TusB component (DsrH family)
VISQYLESLAGALSFDRPLSRRVRQEVEDHLRQAVGADPVGDGIEAQQRAIANFGDPHVIAVQFALVSLAQHIKRVGVAIILLIAGVFIAMKARAAWYAVMQCAISDDIRAASGIVGSIDRYSFWFSVIISIGGWAYISGRRTPAALYAAYRKPLRRFFLLCIAATAGLAVSVISDGVLTALRLPEADLSAKFVIPISSMAIEIACATVLVFQIRGITQRVTATAALLKN